MINRLADMSHEVWAHWMRYLFSVSVQNEDGSVTIPADKVERWKRQIDTNYYDLTEREQKSDISQARKYLAVFRDELGGLLDGVGWGDSINESNLKAYTAYSRGSGPEEGAMLVIAHHFREAKKMAWPVLGGWGSDVYTDLGVRRLHDGSHVFALADQQKLTAGEPHVVDSPKVCDACEFWGFAVDADGRCAHCGEYAGDLLVRLHRDYEARQTAVTQEAQP